MAERPIVAHGNDLRPDEIAKIASHPSATVVWCPRTHAYFGHPPHPVADLLRSGVSVAIGTDSLGSSQTLSLWDDVRFAVEQRVDLDPSEVLQMATLSGADMLGRNDLGRIEPGSSLPLALVPLRSPDATQWQEAVFGRRDD